MENSQSDQSSHTTAKDEQNLVKRGLKPRHLSMIALGGTIGTGLFIASGATISQAGPVGALVAYAIMGAMVYFLMTSLGEMSSFLPVSGSFATHAGRFVDEAFGFAMGWNYWFDGAITIPVEVAAVGLIMKFWLPSIPSWIWSAIVLLLILIVNLTSARAYGEAEFWMATVKVVAILAFIVIGLATIIGIMGHHPDLAKNLSAGGQGGFVGGFGGVLAVFMIAGFSFQGSELVGITAGESENPEKAVPRAIRQVFWRILLFYFVSIFIIGALIYYKDPSLLRAANNNDITVSPFTMVFEQAGLAAAASVMNAVILTSVISSANSWLYASSRMLYALSKEGFAPKIFEKTRNSFGIPTLAMIFSFVIGLLAFLTSIYGAAAFNWLVTASAVSGFIAWVGISLSHYRFRRAFIKQGHDLKELGYRARWFPFGPIVSLVLCVFVIFGQGYGTTYFSGSFTHWNWPAIIPTYLLVPLFVILYKFTKKTKIVPLEEVNLNRDYH